MPYQNCSYCGSVCTSCTELSPSTEHSSRSLCCILGTPASWVSRRCFSSLSDSRDPLSCRSSSFQPPSPSNWSNLLWCFLMRNKRKVVGGRSSGVSLLKVHCYKVGAYQREGLWVMLRRVMPWSLAVWNIFPSTSMLTALVHSSRRANLGLHDEVPSQ